MGEALGARKKISKNDNPHMESKSQKRLEHKLRKCDQIQNYRTWSISLTYRKVPKVTTLITFGFSSLVLSLPSGGRYFQVANVHEPHEVTMIISR